jgi:chemotaxis protein methyltransferase CheR
MNIVSHFEGKHQFIYVLRTLTHEDEKVLMVALRKSDFVTVIFEEVEFISRTIVIELSRIQEHQDIVKFRIEVKSLKLASYLNNLGIENFYIGDKKRYQRNELDQFYDAVSARLNELPQIYNKLLSCYEKKVVTRTVAAMYASSSLSSFDQFVLKLKEEDKLVDMVSGLSVPVTEFFREPLQLKKIKDKLLPLLDSYPQLRFWCVGSSSGEEPYSLAIILEEAGLLEKSVIYATDFNEEVLNIARNGIYPIKELEKLITNYNELGGENQLIRYISKRKTYYSVDEKIMSKVHFFNHNLLVDGSFNSFNVILCRNVIMYFNDECQKDVVKLFSDSLLQSGYLGFSSFENYSFIENDKNFVKSNITNNIYKKV